jgi:hypothetical protein
MITKYADYKLSEAVSNDLNSFEMMMKGPAKLFYDDVRDQLYKFVDELLVESQYQTLMNPSSYFAVFMYKGHTFKMRLTSRGMSAYCFHVVKAPSKYSPLEQYDDGVYKDIGSLSSSIPIMFKKIDKFLKNNA